VLILRILEMIVSYSFRQLDGLSKRKAAYSRGINALQCGKEGRNLRAYEVDRNAVLRSKKAAA
jgi:hypothetical protein